MAKVKFEDGGVPTELFASSLNLVISPNGNKAFYNDGMTGGMVVLEGRNLSADMDSPNLLASGRVETLEFRINQSDKAVTVTGFDVKAVNLNAAFETGGAYGLFHSLLGGNDRIRGGSSDDTLTGLKGNDRIIGGAGQDQIDGGRGDDILTGGKHVDTFIFSKANGVGHDRITDFQLTGGNRDYLELEMGLTIDHVGKTHGGKDTLITFDNGATLELDGVRKADFIDYWDGLMSSN